MYIIYSQQTTQTAGVCGDHIVISDTSSDELRWEWDEIRSGNGLTVAYSVELPPDDCEQCDILVGGANGSTGWVDRLNPESETLGGFMTAADISIQDMAVKGERIVIVGSSTANAMQLLEYDRAGTPAWPPRAVGTGRLRGVDIDENGVIYAVGASINTPASGLLYKYNASGNLIDSDQLRISSGLSYHDISVVGPGNAVIVGLATKSAIDARWYQFSFKCGESCDSP
jgi:hypothetical protein